jgi:hypothetical protein
MEPESSLPCSEQPVTGTYPLLRRIFGPKRDEIIGGRRKLHNEERHNLYSSPNVIITVKEGEMGRACIRMHMGF